MKKVFFYLSFLFICFTPFIVFANETTKQRIFDEANLLTDQQKENLEALAKEHGAKEETDFIIVTIAESDKDIVDYVKDFYDEMAFGYDKAHGNTAILAIDMNERDVFLTGFYKAEKYLDDDRLTAIREKITPSLSSGSYYEAFSQFIEMSSRYMQYPPGFNPDSFLFQTWFHLLASIVVGALIVGAMAHNSGGKVTVNERTYTSDFKVTERSDIYLHKNVTRRRKPKNNNRGGRGGGITRGGHSFSGSRGKF